jgi:hypothetical protein
MKFFNRVRVATATTGHGTLTLGAAIGTNFLTLAEAMAAIEVVAANQIVNGTFASDTAWTKQAGWTIAAGVATATAVVTQLTISQLQTLTEGTRYKVTFTVSGFSAGGVRPVFSGGTAVLGTTRTADGTYTEYLTAGAGNTSFHLQAVGTTTLDIDNVTLEEVIAGATDGDETVFVIEEGADFEIASGVIGGGGTTITRATVYSSKITGTAGTSKMELGGDAEVRFIEGADHLNDLEGRAGFFQKLTEVIYTDSHTVTTNEAGKAIVANKATALTFTLPAVGTSGNETYVFRNIGAGTLSLDANAAELIEGATTLALVTGAAAWLWPNVGKTAWRAAVIIPTNAAIHAAASKTTPVDADEIGLVDSAASFGLKRLTWANLKATLAAGIGHLTAGSVVNSVFGSYAANTNLTTVIPIDDTIPQSNEGTEIIQVAITPKSTTNKLRARFRGYGSVDGVLNIAAAMFLNSDVNAVTAGNAICPAANYIVGLSLEWEWTPGSVAAQTIRIRVGPQAGGIARLNGHTVSRLFGGVQACTLVVEEIKA